MILHCWASFSYHSKSSPCTPLDIRISRCHQKQVVQFMTLFSYCLFLFPPVPGSLRTATWRPDFSDQMVSDLSRLETANSDSSSAGTVAVAATSSSGVSGLVGLVTFTDLSPPTNTSRCLDGDQLNPWMSSSWQRILCLIFPLPTKKKQGLNQYMMQNSRSDYFQLFHQLNKLFGF